MKKRWFLLTAIFALCATQVWARTLSVPSEYSNIQSAINDANNGDVVIVGPGTYQENINFLGKAITVQSVDPNVAAGTIIDGNAPADSNFSSVVTFNSGEDNDSVLSGFTITGGTGSWILVSWEFQGLRWNRCGGGVVCYNKSAPTISKNIFINNIAGQGGGIYIYGDPVNPNNPSNPAIHISPVITENSFISNSATTKHGFLPPNNNYPSNDNGDGGAIVAFQGCDANITGNLIENNHADYYGGGIHLRQWSNGLIEDNQIIDNNSRLGAGVHITYISSPTVRGNVICGNIATNLGGGGIYVYYLSEPLIERNTITENTSGNGAGIGVYYSSLPTIRNNLICKNLVGSGIRIVSSTPTISHNTITANHYCGIECQSSPSLVIENNIITSNEHGWGICVYSSSPTIRYNNLWGNKSGTCGPDIPDQTGINGNICISPQFVNPDNNDYHLRYESRCINAGDPNYVPELNGTDYEGDSRLLGQFVDMGADEAWPLWNITSGGQYENIQQAINDANDGNIIIVTIGTHRGTGNRDIDFLGKAITIRSIDPNDPAIVASTIIDCQGSGAEPHRGFHFRHQEGLDSVLEGLTITNGGGVYDGGAIRCWNHSSPTIRNCIITKNFSSGRGVVYCDNSNPTIINCTLNDNAATSGYGAAFCIFGYSAPKITNCIITNNAAIGHGHHGGGIYCHDHSNAIISNCIISGNSAGHRGGGISAYWSSPTIANCTIIGNLSLEGGGVSSFRESNPFIVNCIIRDNRAPDGNQLALINTLRVWPVSIPTEMTVSYSNVEGGQAEACVDQGCTLHWGDGNIDIDPNFANAGYWDDANTPADPNDDYFVTGNYHLMPISGCVNVGDNNSVPEPSDSDIDGEERIFAGIVDMGADEVVTNPADFNNDGIVDFQDISTLVDEWLAEEIQLESDLYPDNSIDFADYAELARQWLWQGRWYQ